MAGAIVALSAFAFTACEGVGPTGPQGPQGQNLLRVTSNLDIFSTGNIGGEVTPGVEIAVVGTTLLYNALNYVPFDASRTFTPRFYLSNSGTQVSNLDVSLNVGVQGFSYAFHATLFEVDPSLDPTVAANHQLAFVTDEASPVFGQPVYIVVLPIIRTGPDAPTLPSVPAALQGSVVYRWGSAAAGVTDAGTFIRLPTGARRAIHVLPADPAMSLRLGGNADWFGVASPITTGGLTMSYVLPFGGGATRFQDITFVRPRRFVDPPTMPMLTHFTGGLTWTASPEGDSTVTMGTIAAEPILAGRFDGYQIYVAPAIQENGTFTVPVAGWNPITGAVIGDGVTPATTFVFSFDTATLFTEDEDDPRYRRNFVHQLGTGHFYGAVVARGVWARVAAGPGAATLATRPDLYREITFDSPRSAPFGFTITPALPAPTISLEGSTLSWPMVEGANTFRVYRGDVDHLRRPVGNQTLFATVMLGAADNGNFSFDILGGFQTGVMLASPNTLNVGYNSMSVVAVPLQDQPIVTLGATGLRTSVESNVEVFGYRIQ